MSENSERKKKRYAEDPEFRERILATNRASASRNSVQRNERRRQRLSSDPELRERERVRQRESGSRNNYGITLADYDQMLVQQRGGCKICWKPPETKRLCIDHCHATRDVRGLLCGKCNTGLGCFDDDPDLLRRAADYLDESRGIAPSRSPELAAWPLVLTAAVATRPLADARHIFASGPPSA